MFPRKGIFIFRLSLISIAIQSTNARKLKLPEISVSELEISDDYKLRDVSTFQNNGEGEYYSWIGEDLVISGNILGMSLKCSAPYPVYWHVEYDQSHKDDYFISDIYLDINTMTTRVGDLDQTDPEQWSYSATLQFWLMSQSMTRKYICASVHDEKLTTSKFIFSQGYFLNYLLQAGKNLTLSVDSKSVVDGACKLSVQNVSDVPLKLFKEIIFEPAPFFTSRWDLVPLNESITYDPHFGYQFKVRDLPGILGSYKCEADENNENDFVLFDIVLEQAGSIEDVKYEESRIDLQGTASYNFDYKQGTIECCSNSDKPPTIKIIQCTNPSECDLYKPMLTMKDKKHNWHYNHHEYQEPEKRNCTWSWYMQSNFWLNCQGDGIDIFSLFINSFRNSTTVFDGYAPHSAPRNGYFIDPITKPRNNAKFIFLDYVEDVPKGEKNRNELRYFRMYGKTGKTTNMEIFSEQSILFLCYRSTYQFSAGEYWEVIWKNGTSKKYKSEKNAYTDEYLEGFARFGIDLDLGMKSISCFLPFWNSTLWQRESLDLIHVKESIAPKVNSLEHEDHLWYINDTNKALQCSFSGQPVPAIIWRKDGNEVKNNEIFIITTNGSSSQLEIKGKITHDIQGVFVCTGKNLKGISEKSFSVDVKENTSMHTVITVFILLLVTSVFITVGIVGWKMRQKKEMLNNLREHQNQTPSPTSYNHSSSNGNGIII